jgi:hypothetical protein
MMNTIDRCIISISLLIGLSGKLYAWRVNTSNQFVSLIRINKSIISIFQKKGKKWESEMKREEEMVQSWLATFCRAVELGWPPLMREAHDTGLK